MTQTPRSGSPNGRPTPRTASVLGGLLVIALACALVGRPGASSMNSAPTLTLHSPVAGSIGDEGEILLGWGGARRPGEYTVFISAAPLEGRSLEDLRADPAVTRVTTDRTLVPLRELVHGNKGTTNWSWAVALRDPSGRVVLSAPSNFRSVKAFEQRSSNRLLVRETNRGSVTTPEPGGATTIELNNGYRFDPVTDGAPVVPAGLAAAPLHDGEMGSFLVQLKGRVRAEEREAIVAQGATLFSYLPNQTFVVRMTTETRTRVENLPFVRWVGTYEPAFKLSAQPGMKNGAGPGKLTVLLFPDADPGRSRAALENLGGKVLESTDSGRNKLLKVELDLTRVPELASRGEVAWVEPTLELHTMNATAQWVVQTNVTNNRHIWDMGLHGEGQVVHTSDSGIRTTHFAFRDAGVPITTWGDYPTHRKIIAYQPALLGSGILFGDTGGASYHGTHTAGSIVGDDSPFAANANDGMAPMARIWFSDAGATANTITAPGDLNLLFQPPYDGNAGGAARVSSNSWGGDAAGAYTVNSMTADQFMWDHKDFLIDFSNGNAGPQPATVGAPATMKNGISSGACDNGANSGTPADFSSQGPAADGRLKPTLMSPGAGLVSELFGINSANGANDTGYQQLQGTSMSCPTVTGAVLLVRQYLTEGWYPTGVKTPANGFTPSGALLKAMAIASTDNDMNGFPIPNNVVGWGRIKLENILYFPGDAAHTAIVDQADGLVTGDFIEYQVNVTANSVPLKVALCWFDKEGNPAAARQLVNDLDLTVKDPTGLLTYRGNFLQNGESIPAGVRDSLNVEECVRRSSPLTGVWTIRVTGTHVPFGAQPFALAISGGLAGNSGLVELDKLRYGAGDQVEIRVEDLNAVPPVSVSVASTTETTPETLVLSGANGVFTGVINTTPLEAEADGRLSVSHGDQVTVTYADTNPAATVSVNALADFTGPVITQVGGSGVDITHEVTWTTDVPATSRVHYGLTPALGASSPLDADLLKTHTVVLAGLAPESVYYFDVESTDQAGNTTRDDAGGNHYRFSTTASGDILLLVGNSSFPREDLYRAAFKSRGWDASIVTGAATENPVVGDRQVGLRSKSAVLWQAGYEQYPAVPDAARDSLAAYLDGGGRFSICTHDMAWSFTDPTSGYATPQRVSWMQNYLHASFIEDPATWSVNLGVSGDPISGAYTTGVLYTPQRSGGAGDEIALVAGGGTGNFIWSDTDATTNNIALRWQSNTPNGTPASAVWGGTPTRVVTNCYEWAQINDAASRADILDKTLIWLIGHDHPDVVVSSPNGGEVVTSNQVGVSWTETAFGGNSVAARSIYYTSDGGASWHLVTSNAGASPYTWNVGGLPNSSDYRIRVTVTDSASPALRGSDESNGAFALNRPGGDLAGPAVVAGSIVANPNPMSNEQNATLTAKLTDEPFGNAWVTQAEWSYGPAPASPGAGHPMSGTFAASVVTVTGTVADNTVPAGVRKFWVRGRDEAGNWGNATAQEFTVNGSGASGVGSGALPTVWALEQNSPNPFNPTTTIRFSLPAPGPVELTIYNIQGRKVKSLVSGPREAGYTSVIWDGRSDTGAPVASGIYFYALQSGNFRSMKKMVVAK